MSLCKISPMTHYSPASNFPGVLTPSLRSAVSLPLKVTMRLSTDRATASAPPPKRAVSGLESRVSLIFALAAQTNNISQRLLFDLASETAKYVFPKRFESRNLEEALMSVPDLETVKFKVLSRRDEYEMRDVENTTQEKMEMTTPVVTSKTRSGIGEKMEMTTPVITTKAEDEEKWRMSFILPSKYGSNLPSPKDPSVRIKEVPRKVVAVVAFSGFVSDEEVKQQEVKLRAALRYDKQYAVKEGASVEVAQYNPPFTLPFNRRNEIAIELERKEDAVA